MQAQDNAEVDGSLDLASGISPQITLHSRYILLLCRRAHLCLSLILAFIIIIAFRYVLFST